METKMIETPTCPYCGTKPIKNIRTQRTKCECCRLHENTFNNKKYWVLYRKDGTKEIMRNG